MKSFKAGRAARVRLASCAAAAALGFAAVGAARAESAFDDIRFWVGEGTNQASVVVDWGRDDASAVMAWGYRWNGDATAADAILALDAEDPRIAVASAQTEYGLQLNGFTYRAEDGETFDAAAEDHYGETGMRGFYWALSSAPAGGVMALAAVGASSLVLEPGGRVGLKWTWYSYDYATYAYDGGDTSVAEDAAVAATVPPFAMDDIHFWVGGGTNRAALVVDFGLDGFSPRAWGFRWKGDAVNLAELVTAVAHEDPRLGFYANPAQSNTFAAAFSYDAGDAAASFHLASATATDPEAWFTVPRSTTEGSVTRGEFWNIAKGSGDAFEDIAAWTDTTGMDEEVLVDGTWYLFRLNWYVFDTATWAYGQGEPAARRPRPAESPYGWRVAASALNPADPYSRPDAAIGRPAVDAPESSWGSLVYPPSPIHPGAPSSRPADLVSLTSPDEGGGVRGSVTVEFDHPVVDDPRNPFGIDFIVFGNALQILGGGAEVLGTDDPATVRFDSASVDGEEAIVEVSQDGATWLSATNWPCADAFAPTLGRLYDPEHPDPALFAGTDYTNKYWGRPAHATIPVDPAVSGANFNRRTLADYATLYNGSAGGTGFDIADLDLSRDAKGRKWVRFVRITASEAAGNYQTAPEIDAVADVAPAPSFRNWVDEWVPFDQRPGYAKTNICANGSTAAVNAALGRAPDAEGAATAAVGGFDPATGTLAAPIAPYASDLVRLQRATDLAAGAWTAFLPLWAGIDEAGHPQLQVQGDTEESPTGFFRLEVDE